LARQSYFAEEDFGFSKDSTQFLHTEHFILVDRHLELEAQQLIKDIVVLKNSL